MHNINNQLIKKMLRDRDMQRREIEGFVPVQIVNLEDGICKNSSSQSCKPSEAFPNAFWGALFMINDHIYSDN